MCAEATTRRQTETAQEQEETREAEMEENEETMRRKEERRREQREIEYNIHFLHAKSFILLIISRIVVHMLREGGEGMGTHTAQDQTVNGTCAHIPLLLHFDSEGTDRIDLSSYISACPHFFLFLEPVITLPGFERETGDPLTQCCTQRSPPVRDSSHQREGCGGGTSGEITKCKS
jgi:uncharacterized protein (DUF4415 family)